MFLGKSESEIAQIALETLEGHQRAIMAHMTVEVRRPRPPRIGHAPHPAGHAHIDGAFPAAALSIGISSELGWRRCRYKPRPLL